MRTNWSAPAIRMTMPQISAVRMRRRVLMRSRAYGDGDPAPKRPERASAAPKGGTGHTSRGGSR